MAWRAAASLTKFIQQINDLAPDRSKKSDGTVGDAAHQSRQSDHNPWIKDGPSRVVSAADITHDPDKGCDCDLIVKSLIESRDKRIKYIIWDKKIWRSYDKPTVKAWDAQDYRGSNPHTKHLHLSVNSQKKHYDNIDPWDVTPLAKSAIDIVIGNILAEAGLDPQIAWGAMVSPAFKAKVIKICNGLQIDPNDLMAVMAFESARTFRPDVENPLSGAVGLIQFTKKTAEGMGTSIPALKAMTAEEQLDIVEQYFRPYHGRLNDIFDVYMAVLWPRAVGKMKSYVLFEYPSRQYKWNKGLDANTDGAITKAEAAAHVLALLNEGLQNDRVG